MQVNRAALLAALLTVRPAIASRSYLPALTHVRFAPGRVTAFDEVVAITTRLDDDVTGVDACVPGEPLIAALQQFTGEHVAVEVKEGAMVLKQGKARVRLALLPGADFPFTAAAWEPNKALPFGGELAEALEACAAGAGKDEALPATLGVTVCELDGRVAAFATDNRTITSWETSMAWSRKAWPAPFLLPTKFCTVTASLLAADKSGEPGLLCVNDGRAVADVGDGRTTVVTRLQSDFKLIDFVGKVDSICPPEVRGNAMRLPDGFDGAMARALLIVGNEQYPAVELSAGVDELAVRAESTTGSSNDYLALDGNEATVGACRVDPSVVMRAAKRCDSFLPVPGALAMFGQKGALTVLIANVAR